MAQNSTLGYNPTQSEYNLLDLLGRDRNQQAVQAEVSDEALEDGFDWDDAAVYKFVMEEGLSSLRKVALQNMLIESVVERRAAVQVAEADDSQENPSLTRHLSKLLQLPRAMSVREMVSWTNSVLEVDNSDDSEGEDSIDDDQNEAYLGLVDEFVDDEVDDDEDADQVGSAENMSSQADAEGDHRRHGQVSKQMQSCCVPDKWCHNRQWKPTSLCGKEDSRQWKEQPKTTKPKTQQNKWAS
jgi:hypothetical protein